VTDTFPTHRAHSLGRNRLDITAIDDVMARGQALRAPGSGLIQVTMPYARHVFLDGCPNLTSVDAPQATHVHVSGCLRLRTLVTCIPPATVPPIRDLPRLTVAVYDTTEAERHAAISRGQHKHGLPWLSWPHMIVKAAEAHTSAVVNMVRGMGGALPPSIETAAAVLCLAARPDAGVPDWLTHGDGTAQDAEAPWVTAMRQWGKS
jgi:hypothetical protein